MSISVRWVGFDFGGTIQNGSGGYQGTIDSINEIFTELGKPEIIGEKVTRFNELLAKYGYEEEMMYGVDEDIEFWKRHYRFKRLQEKGLTEFFSYVLDNNQDAIKLYQNKRLRHFKATDGLNECLEYLKNKGVSVNIVSELGSEGTLNIISSFLSRFNLWPYFSDVITNYGRIKNNGDLDLSFKGTEKIDGTIYKRLVRDLLDAGIEPSQALMIGDHPVEDVEKAKENGFYAIQFTGVIKRRVSNAADYVISDLRELKKII